METTSNVQRLRHLLDDGRKCTLKQLQDYLNLSERQVRRLLQQIKDSGLVVRTERQHRQKLFYLDEQDQQTVLPDTKFSQAELRALTLAIKASQGVLAGTPHAQPLQSVFNKLLEKVPPVAYVFDVEDQLKEWQFDENIPDPIVMDNFRTLEQAINQRCSVAIDYTTASSGKTTHGRIIDPYFFAKRGRSWMVVGYCHQRKALRNFALVRISQVSLCEEAFFTIPEDFVPEHYFRGALGAINSDTCYVLRLRVEPNKARYFKDRQYHPTQVIEEEHLDGRLIVSYELEGFEEMRSFVQGWGTGVTVVAPAQLQERIYHDSAELIKRYSTENSNS